MTGDVLVDAALPALRGEVAVAVLWNGGRFADDTADQSISAELTFPSQYTLNIYQPPPDNARQAMADADPEDLFAMGLLLLFEDLDGDAQLDLDAERVLGGANGSVINWSTREPAPPANGAAPRDPRLVDADGGTYAVREVAPGGCAPGPNPANAGPVEVQLVTGFSCADLPDPDCRPETREWRSLCGGG